MELILTAFGMEIFKYKFEKTPKPTTQVFNNCIWDNRQPIVSNANNKNDMITKTVSREDYSAVCEIISERTGVEPEKVDQVLKISAEFIGKL